MRQSDESKPLTEATEPSQSAAKVAVQAAAGEPASSSWIMFGENEPTGVRAARELTNSPEPNILPAEAAETDGEAAFAGVPSDVVTFHKNGQTAVTAASDVATTKPETSKSATEEADNTEAVTFHELSLPSAASQESFFAEALEESSPEGSSNESTDTTTSGRSTYSDRHTESTILTDQTSCESYSVKSTSSDETSWESYSVRSTTTPDQMSCESYSVKSTTATSDQSTSGSYYSVTSTIEKTSRTPENEEKREDSDLELIIPDYNIQVQLYPGTIVRGYTKHSKLTGRLYACFTDIPYAEPPVRNLRFKPPQPYAYASRIGIINLPTITKKICIQTNSAATPKLIGSEDCLYLDIYTPDTPNAIFEKKELLPVMVFIHGGGFHHGSGSSSTYVPDCFMRRNVIFVTINYRLHIFGFLTLDIPECTGNFGLKDQVMALKWIQRNISKFGGDRQNVTIFGSSAGGAAVNLHMVSPLSRGLFHKAISQSGTTLCPWGITQNSKLHVYDIARRLGCKSKNEIKILNFFKRQTAEDLTKITNAVAVDSKTKYFCEVFDDSFGPSVECVVSGAFLPLYPSKLQYMVEPVPTIAGLAKHEGLMVLRGTKPDLIQELSDDLSPIFSHNFVCKKKTTGKKGKIHRMLRAYYFSNQKIERKMTEQMSNLFTDVSFSFFYESFEFLRNSPQPVYFYEFCYDGELNFFKLSENDEDRKAIRGAAHSDELSYLFYPLRDIHTVNEQDKRMVHIMSNMWTSFAKCGNPTAELESKIVWKPSTPRNPCYLKIDEKLSLESGKINEKRFEFMNSLLKNTAENFFD